MKVIGVRFKSTKKIYYFNPNDLDIKKGDNVVVDTSRGIEFGQTVIGIKDVPEDEIVQPLQNVVRIATPEDERTVQYNEERRQDAIDKCQQKIEKHGLDMKLVDAEYTFDQTKLIFYFTSDGRVDFRDLVKDLALLFRTRIELRQIAVRDETKMLGGLGACGNEICCKRFLGDFASVSIKMAKDQNLSLNPTKISGLCGRLICCLNFEKNFYSEMNEILPSVGELVISPKGQAEVVQTYPLKESVRVKYSNTDGSTDTAVFKLAEITRTHEVAPDAQIPQKEDENDSELQKLADAESNDVAQKASPEKDNKQKDFRNGKYNSGKQKYSKEHRQENNTEEKTDTATADDAAAKTDEGSRQNYHKDFRKPQRPYQNNKKAEGSEEQSEGTQLHEKKTHFPDRRKNNNQQGAGGNDGMKDQNSGFRDNQVHQNNGKNLKKKFNNFKPKDNKEGSEASTEAKVLASSGQEKNEK